MEPVALGIKVPDAMSSLGQVMNVANSANQYRAGQIANESNQQTLQERNNVRGLFQDPSSILGEDGNIDFTKAAPKIMAAAPTQGGQILAGLYTAQNQSIQAKREINSLGISQREQLGQLVGSLGQVPPDQGLSQFDAFIQANPQLRTAGAFAREHILAPAAAAASDPTKPDPSAWTQATSRMRLSVMGPDSQRAALTPGGIGVSNGIQTGTINTNPDAGLPVGAAIPGTTQTQFVPLGQQQTLGADASNRPIAINKDASGNILGISSVPVQGEAATSKPFVMPAGETQDTLKLVQGIRNDANNAVRSAGDQTFNANQIIEYADKGLTGTGAGYLTNLRGGLTGLHLDNADSAATNTQLLGHAIAQQTATAAAAAGLNGSNASRDLASNMTADGKWTAPAIQSSARVMRALGSTGAQLYNQGIETAVKAGGPFAARDFQTAWSNAASIDGIRLYDAKRNLESDPKGLAQVIDSLGGVKSTRYEFALKKIDAMGKLIRGQ